MPTFNGTPATSDTQYCTLAEMKATDVLNISNTDHDAILDAIIFGVSRAIDNQCARFFYNVTETHYYTAAISYRLSVDDISTASGLLLYTDDNGDGTYENTWAATDYNLFPYNAALGGDPFESIETTPVGQFRFPVGIPKGVKVTATFGYAAVPKPINRACVLQATRLFKRYITPLGVSAASAVGEIKLTVPALDSDIKFLVNSYTRWHI